MLMISEVYDSFIREALENSWTIEQVKMLGCENCSEAGKKLEELIEDEGWEDSLTLECWAEYVET